MGLLVPLVLARRYAPPVAAAAITYVGATINRASAGNGTVDLQFSGAVSSPTSDYETGFTLECRQPSGTWRTLDATKYTCAVVSSVYIRVTLTGTVNTFQASHEFRCSYNSAVGNIVGLATFAETVSNVTNNSTIDLLSGVLERWSLDETSGVRVASIVPTTHDLTDTNTVLYGAGKISNAADFEATNIEMLSVASKIIASGSFEIGVWINAESIEGPGGFNDVVLQTPIRIRILGTGSALWCMAGAAEALGATALSTATWYAVNLTFDGTNVVVFLNGTQDGTVAEPSPDYTGTAFSFGRHPAGSDHAFDGLMDEPTAWSRVLSAAERADWKNGTSGKAWPYCPDYV